MSCQSIPTTTRGEAMPTVFGNKIKPDKGQKIVSAFEPALLPGEEILFLAKCNNIRPMCDHVAITNFRVAGLSSGKIAVEFQYARSLSLVVDSKRETLLVAAQDGQSMLFKMVQREDHDQVEAFFSQGQSATPPVEALQAYEAAQANLKDEAARLERARASLWPSTRVVGGKLSSKASQAILRQCNGDEQPWLILVSSGGAGLLAAFDDRLAIIKTGALTSFMAGSLGGERAATFHFRDVTGIEYNSGFVNGVLEILTPSYSGTANRDFWRGSNSSRNADSNDPWTLSNCLPLPKSEYNAALPEVSELRSRVSKSKEVVVNVSAALPTQPGLADEIQRLAELRDSGVLTEGEFAEAKRRVLTGE
jgi:hypothetical protein